MRIKLFIIALVILICGLAAVRFLTPSGGSGNDSTALLYGPGSGNDDTADGSGPQEAGAADGAVQTGISEDTAADISDDPAGNGSDTEKGPLPLPDSMIPENYTKAEYDETLFDRNTVIWAIQNRIFTEGGEPRQVGKDTIDFLLERMSTRPAPTDGEAALAWMEYKKYLEAESQDPSSPDFIDMNTDTGYELPCGDPVTLREVLQTGYTLWNTAAEGYIIPDVELIRWSDAYRLCSMSGSSGDAPDDDPGSPALLSEDLEREAGAADIARIFYFAEDGEFELENSLMRLPYFYQGVGFFDGYVWRHPEWFAARFSINGHTMEEAGCGFFSTAMALSWISGKIIPPTEFMENGQYTGNGAAHTVGVVSAEQYSIPARKETDWAKIEEALKTGHPVMVLLSGTTRWSVNGHYVMLSGIQNDGQVCLINPGATMHATYNAFDHSLADPSEINGSVNPDFPYTVFG